MRVIGAGFGRTGTLSTRTALERLTGGRCYHMFEALSHPEHLPAWLDADEGRLEGLADVLAGYSSTVDWPGCSLWRDLMELFPDAKVLLSTRPAERWWASYEQTVHQLMLRGVPDPETVDPDFYLVSLFGSRLTKRSFPSDYAHLRKEDFIAAYEQHNAEVRAGVPEHRVLEFDVEQGWAPLCEFLEVAVPDEPFPRLNDTAGFRALFGLDADEGEVRSRQQGITRDTLQERFGAPGDSR